MARESLVSSLCHRATGFWCPSEFRGRFLVCGPGVHCCVYAWTCQSVFIGRLDLLLLVSVERGIWGVFEPASTVLWLSLEFRGP